jgi:Cdc6-like AAA superfamily ATPase
VHVKAQELDDLVQQLAVAKYALEAGDTTRAHEAVDAAMTIARRVLTRKQSETGHADPMVRTTSAGD